LEPNEVKTDPMTFLAKERNMLASERTWLAAERTFSAWMRTGLAGVGGGLGVIHFLFFENPVNKFAANLLGELLILWGIAIFAFAYISYTRFCKRLERITGYRRRQVILGGIVAMVLFLSVVFLIMNLFRLF
jgi:putative membrane protein